MLQCSRCRRLALQRFVGISLAAQAHLTTSSRAFDAPTRPPKQASHHASGLRSTRSAQDHTLAAQRQTDGASAPAESVLVSKYKPRIEDEPAKRPNRANVEKQLRYLPDPVKLAEYVLKRCNSTDGFVNARELVRTASKTMQCTVSWNHLINYQMAQGQMNQAFKTYNEMKKRAQIPDAWTYTALIRGCTMHKFKKEALEKGLYVYRSMMAEKSPVKPNQIHTNAIIKLCARAGDISTMLEIAADLPPSGPSAPDNITFTTIFNAMHEDHAIQARRNDSPEQSQHNAQKVLSNSRQIWADIISRWRKGDLWIDEDLVCSMGRCLLLGGRQDHGDVLNLLVQTMNIPRQGTNLPSNDRLELEPTTPSSALLRNTGKDIEELGHDSKESEPALPEKADDTTLTPTTPKSRLVAKRERKQQLAPRSGGLTYATPGQNTLSLVLAAHEGPEQKASALRYWQYFTQTASVVPDAANFHAFLRILRQARASMTAFELVRSMPVELLANKTFILALSACRRDVNNPNCFRTAAKLLDLMTEVIPIDEQELRVYQTYLDLAIAFSERRSGSGRETKPRSDGNQTIQRALERVKPIYLSLSASYSAADAQIHKADLDRAASLTALVNKMIGAHDTLIDRGSLPKEDLDRLQHIKSRLGQFYAVLSEKVRCAERSGLVVSDAVASSRNREQRRTSWEPAGSISSDFGAGAPRRGRMQLAWRREAPSLA